MHLAKPLVLLLAHLAAATPSPSSIPPGCPPDGPLLPRPTSLSTSPLITNATTRLTRSLRAALSGEIKAGWDVQNVSFSLALVSPFDTASSTNGSSIWEFHHLSDRNENGTTRLDSDSQFLIGSVSKVFTDLMVLRSGVDVDRPVTEFLPELKGEGGSSPVRWGDVTLRALTEHLAGITQNCMYGDVLIY